jgi:micrococcal nuclease
VLDELPGARAAIRRRVALAALACVIGTGPACAAAEPGTVVRVIDGDSLEIAVPGAKLEVRLLGVDTPELGHDRQQVEFFAEEALQFTRKLAHEGRVVLETDPQGDTRDTYGRALRYVRLSDGRLLNAEIIAQGYGHAYTRYPFTRLEEFRALERAARVAGRGLWGGTPPRLAAADAGSHLGKIARVCGQVASARFVPATDGRPTFLNLDRPHPNQAATIVIWGPDRAAFGEPERVYAGRRICVTGKIDSFAGRAQIEARDPSQIEADPAPGQAP